MSHGSRPILKYSIAGCLSVLPQVAWADGEIRASADLSASAGWSSNPFSEIGHDLGSPFVDVDFRPVVSLVNEHSTLALSGLLDYQHYFRDYSDTDDYGVGLDYSSRLNSRLSVHASARFDSSIIGGFDSFTPAVDPTQPQQPVINGQDIALIGTRDRRNTLSFGGDLSYSLSAYDSITANAYYSKSHYGGVEAFSDYDNYGGGFGYSRRVSQRLQLGIQASASRYIYRGLLGDSQVYSLQATFKDQISDQWTVSGALGASFSSQSFGGNRTNLTGNIQLCRQSSRSTACLTASDAVLPTGGTGTVDTKSVGGNYSYRLTEHSTISASAEYSHNGQPVGMAFGDPFDVADSYLTLSGGYDRLLRPRLHLIASAHYRKIIGGEFDRAPADAGGSLGITYRFGDSR